MKFEMLTVSSVKSISQRRLLAYWSELADDRRFPAFSDFHIDSRIIDPKSLLIWSIERSAGRRTFRSRYHSSRLAEALQGDWVGKTMDEMLPEGLRQYARDTAIECADSGCAVFSILSTLDADGHRVDCERLLLPFGKAGQVEYLVASMQLISLRGNFQRQTVLDAYRKTFTVELAGRIQVGLSRNNLSADSSSLT